MTIRTKILGALALAGAAAIAVQPVEARDGRNAALAAGAVGGFALGAAAGAAASGPHYYGGTYAYEAAPDCYVESRRVWDDYRGVWRVRRVRVCD